MATGPFTATAGDELADEELFCFGVIDGAVCCALEDAAELAGFGDVVCPREDDETPVSESEGLGELTTCVLAPVVCVLPVLVLAEAALAPPPQAAVSKGAIKAMTMVVFLRRRCQVNPLSNCRRLINPRSINTSPSSDCLETGRLFCTSCRRRSC